MTKSRSPFPSSSSSVPASKLGLIDQSQVIAKLRPKIRIIHVDAPKIIQTDAANFRDLVQRLTGKPGEDNKMTMETEEQDFLGLGNGMKKIKNKDDNGDEMAIRRKSKSNKEMGLSGFFDHHHGGFSELDGFMEQLSTL